MRIRPAKPRASFTSPQYPRLALGVVVGVTLASCGGAGTPDPIEPDPAAGPGATSTSAPVSTRAVNPSGSEDSTDSGEDSDEYLPPPGEPPVPFEGE